ncbi:MAG: four helix bundle protein [Candidatus Nealsonbacteria bacterium]|nr:MAG: four helix bundle protein [Candidatus Nealsonbacteria bacterium]
MNNNIFRFREFPVYKDALSFRGELKSFSKKYFPKEEQFCLTSQLWRALDSVILNIAEGSDRYSDIDFSRFLNNALTSVNEIVACLDAALGDKYITKQQHREYLLKAENLYRQLKAFASKVRKSS